MCKERQVFYIDLGDMPSDRAAVYFEMVRTQMQQRNIEGYGLGVEGVGFAANLNPVSIQS